MITWLGRAFGWNGTKSGSGEAGGTFTAAGLAEVAVGASSIVDSDDVAAELARARRYEHDLAIAVLSARPLEPRDLSDRGASLGAGLPQMIALLTAVTLREVLRGSDVVCYHAAGNRFILALPESDSARAHVALRRIRTHLHERLRLRVRAGVASFPTDALTLDELIASAASAADGTEVSAESAERRVPAAGNGNGNGKKHRKGHRKRNGKGDDRRDARRRTDTSAADAVRLAREPKP